MARKRKSQKRSWWSHIVGWFSLWVTVSMSAGVGGWAYPNAPILGRLARAFVSRHPVSSREADALKTIQYGVEQYRNYGVQGAEQALRDVIQGTSPTTGSLPTTPIGSPRTNTPEIVQRQRPPVTTASYQNSSTNSRDYLTIASFNIQVFGTSKLADRDVMSYLVDIVRRFDLVAIQEVRSKDDQLIPQFVQWINADGRRYDHIIGPRLGRSNSKEQYTFIYNTDRLEYDSRSVFTFPDEQDQLHRPPLFARFRVKTSPPQAGFTFWIGNIHTDPDEVPTEVDALGTIYETMQQQGWGEDDIIVLGDLNASETQLGRLGTVRGMYPAIRGVPTNTRGTKTYDNILFTMPASSEFTGRSGVLDLKSDYRLSEEQALKVSDHLPVWASFSIYEQSAGR